jgi:hypothetical protein
MKLTFFTAVVLFAVLLTAGCDTFARRSQQKADTFAALSPAEREKLKRGVIELGNSPDMVYIALGRPDEQHEKTTPQGKELTWVYNSYHQEFAGTLHTGYRRIVVFDPGTRRYLVYFEPVYADVYRDHTEERIRIKFRDGKVVEIEQPKE